MAREKIVGLFCDVSNLYYCCGKKFPGKKLLYSKYIDKAKEVGDLYRAFAYCIQTTPESENFVAVLKRLGFEPKCKKPKKYETEGKREFKRFDWDVGLAMDVVRLIKRLDTVIIGSADADLVPLVEWIKEQGVECIVFAFGINSDLKKAADKWYDIDDEMVEGKNVPV